MIGGVYKWLHHEVEPPQLLEPVSMRENVQSQDEPQMVVVDIKGEVKHPGVYTMTSQDRVLNVIDKAGGLTEQANTISINLSAKVTDEMLIYIPNSSEQTSQVRSQSISDKININQANLDELQQLSGIGASKAQSILDYRQQHRFRTIEELKQIEGIGDKLFERIKNKIAV